MSEPESRRGRAHDAEGAQEAILNAAEEVFAEHGFDGARIAAIGEAAGYNTSLIFHYFGDKLGLYTAVIRRADREMNESRALQFASLLEIEDETLSDVDGFKTLLKEVIGAFFDYLVAHPRFMRIIAWEIAEGWHTYAKVITQPDREDVDRLRPLIEKMQRAGLLRSNFDPAIQIVMAVFYSQHYLGFIPLFQMLLPGEDFSSPAALARAREYITEFIIRGLLVDPTNK